MIVQLFFIDELGNFDELSQNGVYLTLMPTSLQLLLTIDVNTSSFSSKNMLKTSILLRPKTGFGVPKVWYQEMRNDSLQQQPTVVPNGQRTLRDPQLFLHLSWVEMLLQLRECSTKVATVMHSNNICHSHLAGEIIQCWNSSTICKGAPNGKLL